MPLITHVLQNYHRNTFAVSNGEISSTLLISQQNILVVSCEAVSNRDCEAYQHLHSDCSDCVLKTKLLLSQEYHHKHLRAWPSTSVVVASLTKFILRCYSKFILRLIAKTGYACRACIVQLKILTSLKLFFPCFFLLQYFKMTVRPALRSLKLVFQNSSPLLKDVSKLQLTITQKSIIVAVRLL